MIRDLLTAIWRSAWRERRYALLNLAGLALGFACCLLLALFLRDQLSHDRHFDHHERIYRLAGQFTTGTTTMEAVDVPRALGPMLAADYPQIEGFVRFTGASLQDGLRLRHGDVVLNWRRTFFASPSVFRVFSHHVLAGDPDTALLAESSVAISSTLAKAYFGDANPIGQILRTDAGQPWRVTLVFDDLPPNTHLRYDALFSDTIPLLRDAQGQAGLRRQLMGGYSGYVYLLMKPGFDAAEWSRIGPEFVKRYIEDGTQPPGTSVRFWLQPLAAIHYTEPLLGDQPTGSRVYLYGCFTVALFILCVACINYTNLAIARAMRRARAVGIRKILGAQRGRLLLEFLLEAGLYSLVAAVLGVALAEAALTLTPIGDLLGNVRLDISSNLPLLGWVLGAAMSVGLASGLYPAIYLSAWMPVAAFSNRGGGALQSGRLREALVVLQFVMAVGVVAAMLVMGAQMRYVASTPLGFQRENVVMVTIRGTDRFAAVAGLAQELKRNASVLSVTQTATPPGRFRSGGFINAETNSGAMEPMRGDVLSVGADFRATLGMELVAGQDFAVDDAERGGQVYLVNEALVRERGWKDPIGRRVLNGRVIGVLRDFHVESLRTPIAPLALTPLSDDPSRFAEAQRPLVQRFVMIRVSGRDLSGALAHIGKVMAQFDPGNPFEYTMLDETLRDLYSTERRMLVLVAIFGTLCIFIACLGLFGLTAFATRQRAREIATRKVLGASPWQVVWLLARRFLLLICAGGMIAAAIAWLVMEQWLAGFAYRVAVSPALLLLSILLAASVALGTVALQSLRTAVADPAEALRRE